MNKPSEQVAETAPNIVEIQVATKDGAIEVTSRTYKIDDVGVWISNYNGNIRKDELRGNETLRRRVLFIPHINIKFAIIREIMTSDSMVSAPTNGEAPQSAG